ncbi:MAG: amine dehydrogenase [Betaproteobacteria bacterium]|nr:amine dehydrogenase [Betaproteobacteria bacterium]MBL8533455.1 amine dehydrogenase [Betaproteobacteria bacterium]
MKQYLREWGVRSLRWSALSLAAAALLHPVSSIAQLPAETLSTEPVVKASQRVYIPDIAINHIADGKLHIVDGETGAYQGVIGTGFTGQTKLSLDGKEIYIATGYYSRGQRGERTDIVEVWDADSLRFKYEIPISDKRAMALNYKWLLSLSSDSRWLFVQNATPATSVTVVDLQAKKAVSEISLPGCWAVFPVRSQPNRFGTLCGDGTVQMVTVADDGSAADRTISDTIFDPDADALFIQGEATGDTYHFVSFTGNVVSVDMSGAKAKAASKWSLVSAAERKKGWRPGGYQVLALHEGSGRMYVAMHEGGAEGSHKSPAKEIWGFDLASRKRVLKMPGHMATAIGTSSDGKRLYAIDAEKASLVIVEIGRKPKVRGVFQVGEFPSQIEVN